MSKFKIGIVGATGYTGSELVRILYNHPEVEIAAITSETYQGKLFSDVHSQFQDIFEPELISVKDLPEDLDVVFLALPHGVSMDFRGFSMDFRGFSIEFRVGHSPSWVKISSPKHV